MKKTIQVLVYFLVKRIFKDEERRIGEQFSAIRKIMLRNERCFRVEKMSNPCSFITSTVGDYSLGYSMNLLNNAYCFCKIARRNGVDAKLFFDPGFADVAITSFPQWEEVYFKASEMPQNIKALPSWDVPDFIKLARWDLDYLNKISNCFEYRRMQEILKDAAVDIIYGNELSYLLAYTVLPHLDLLKLYKTVDLIHASGSHIAIASFTNKPYVTFPFGGDLFITPFEDNESGWMQARGFRRATRHIIGGNIMMDYMDALGIPRKKIDLIPFMIDTDIYAPCQDDFLYKQLRTEYPGKVIFLLGARQNWQWKGSDKFWRALAKVKNKLDNAIFLTVWYGQDTKQSSDLIEELDLNGIVTKIGVLSKVALRKYINAVDVCIDQFTHGGLGTFALESMSCAKPLITYYSSDKHFNFEKNPPIFSCFSEGEIAEAILFCVNKPDSLRNLGHQHREWIKRYHSHEVLWPAYDAVYRKALAESKDC
ncbi:MAG: glycosyltransferase [Candidatus Omnitrophota bacterium]